MVGCALAVMAASFLYYREWPDFNPRAWLIMAFAPLTALAIRIAGSYWTYRVRPSIGESFGALLVVTLITLGIIATIAGMLDIVFLIVILAPVSLCFAPSWFLATVIGTAMQRRRDVRQGTPS